MRLFAFCQKLKMENKIFGIENFDVYGVIGILIFFGLLEVLAGYLNRTKRTGSDWIQEVGGFFMLSVVIKPTVVFFIFFICNYLFPDYSNFFVGRSLLILLPSYLLIDDVLQYWYHRLAHEHEFLWKLHRPHHQAEEMGFFVSYRNAGLYYVLMPNIWWVGLFTFLGGAKAVVIGLVLKQLVIIGSHSMIKWDVFLYKYKLLNPLAFVLERLIVTPAFHHAHHGKTMRDGISDPNGNFGNMFSIWDQLFGSAKFTRQFPSDYGLENDPKEHWSAAYLYPIVASSNPNSEISRRFKKTKTTLSDPAIVQLEKDMQYLWCQCGRSKNQPFCDSSHHGSKFKPLLFEVKKSGAYRLCQCKETKAKPFCDNSHIALKISKNLE